MYLNIKFRLFDCQRDCGHHVCIEQRKTFTQVLAVYLLNTVMRIKSIKESISLLKRFVHAIY